MNFLDPKFPAQREAQLRYLDGEYQVLKVGEFVRCAVSGNLIRLDDLKYWSVDKQVAYSTPKLAFEDLFGS